MLSLFFCRGGSQKGGGGLPKQLNIKTTALQSSYEYSLQKSDLIQGIGTSTLLVCCRLDREALEVRVRVLVTPGFRVITPGFTAPRHFETALFDAPRHLKKGHCHPTSLLVRPTGFAPRRPQSFLRKSRAGFGASASFSATTVRAKFALTLIEHSKMSSAATATSTSSDGIFSQCWEKWDLSREEPMEGRLDKLLQASIVPDRDVCSAPTSKCALILCSLCTLD